MITTVGFVGLGNIGAKLAASLLRNGYDVAVLDLEPAAAAPLLDAGATWRSSPADLAHDRDLVITCLPTPAASATVVEGPDGLLRGLRPARCGPR
jgi:3-hydroxyisobutyrate dehydrogenase